MKKEDLFKAMSDLDQDIVAETRDEGIEVKPIVVTESKRKFSYKPIIATAASCALIMGTAAAVINGAGETVVNIPAQYTNETVNDIGEPSVWQSAYPESAKYQYKGDYSEFKNFGAAEIDVMAYNTYRDLLNNCDLAVLGEFTDDPWQDIDPNDTTDIYHLNFSSYNSFKIDQVLTQDGSTTAEQGTEIIIRQFYAIKNREIISSSQLTPMLKGDRWVYFLKYDEENNTYTPLSDYYGRYPDPYYYQVLNSDPDIKDSANRFLPAMTNKYGLTDGRDFNENIYRTLADVLYHEYMPPVQCLHDSESSGLYNIACFEPAECPGVVFNVLDGTLYIDQPWSSVDPNGLSVTGTDILHKIYTADVTGDGNNDVCIQLRSANREFGEYIMIYDCFNNKIYHIMGETGKTEYYLGEADGKLLAYKSELTSDGSRGAVISHENLSSDMTDSWLAFDFSGHSERCIYDSDYCSKQEGDCPHTSGHHNEVTSDSHHEEDPEHHGHSEYCLQDTNYCSQQEGECPYTGNHHTEEPKHHGHSEYCLQDANYCAQQEGECPYTGGHHEEGSEHHGHSEYCLQNADYCSLQEGECPYTGGHHDSGSSGGHHGNDHH